jgi:hypothetical protein
MEDVGVFYDHLVYFTAIFLPFGILHGNLVYFPHSGTLYQEKSGNRAPASRYSQIFILKLQKKHVYGNDIMTKVMYLLALKAVKKQFVHAEE